MLLRKALCIPNSPKKSCSILLNRVVKDRLVVRRTWYKVLNWFDVASDYNPLSKLRLRFATACLRVFVCMCVLLRRVIMHTRDECVIYACLYLQKLIGSCLPLLKPRLIMRKQNEQTWCLSRFESSRHLPCLSWHLSCALLYISNFIYNTYCRGDLCEKFSPSCFSLARSPTWELCSTLLRVNLFRDRFLIRTLSTKYNRIYHRERTLISKSHEKKRNLVARDVTHLCFFKITSFSPDFFLIPEEMKYSAGRRTILRRAQDARWTSSSWNKLSCRRRSHEDEG